MLAYCSAAPEDITCVIKIQKNECKRRKNKSVCISLTVLYGYSCKIPIIYLLISSICELATGSVLGGAFFVCLFANASFTARIPLLSIYTKQTAKACYFLLSFKEAREKT